MGRNCGLSGIMAVGKWQRCVATFLYEGSRKSLDYISCILAVEGQRGIDRLKMFERQCCMDASGGEIVQRMAHPSTVWSTCALPNGDLVAGCADGNAYVWTRAAERVASPDLCAAFKERAAGLDEGRPPCLEDGDFMPLNHQPEGSGRSHATQERRWEACRGLRSSPRAAPKG